MSQLSAQDKNQRMNVERTFMKQWFESAIYNQFSTFHSLLTNYATQNHVRIDDVILQFKDGKKRNIFHFACQSTTMPSSSTAAATFNNNDDRIIANDIVSRILFYHQYSNNNNKQKWISNDAIHQMIRLKDIDGLTPLMLVCQCTNTTLCQSRIVSLLQFVKDAIASSSDPPSSSSNATNNHQENATAVATKKKNHTTKLTIARSKIGATPLHYAAANETISSWALEALYYDAPIALRTTSKKGGTPLHWACSVTSASSSHVEAIRTLIKLCSQRSHEQQYDIINQYDDTIPPALFVCIATNHIEHTKCFIETCIEHQINITPTLQYKLLPTNSTVFHMIVDQNMIAILVMLLEYLQQMNESKLLLQELLSHQDSDGNIPLDIAAREKHSGCVLVLLSYNQSQQPSFHDNNTPIDEATAIQYIEEYHHNQEKAQEEKSIDSTTTTTTANNTIPTLQNMESSNDNNGDSAKTNNSKVSSNTEDHDETRSNSTILQRYDAIVKEKCALLKQQQEQRPSNDTTATTVQLYRDMGNQHYQRKEYIFAIEAYTKAIEIDPTNAIMYSNRSISYLLLHEEQMASSSTDHATATNTNTKEDVNHDADVPPATMTTNHDPLSSSSYIDLSLYDAMMAKELNPTWSKPYYRIASVLYHYQQYEDAAVMAWEGLSFIENHYQSSNNSNSNKAYHQEKHDFQTLLQKCVKKGRKEHLSSLQSSSSSSNK